MTKSSPDEKSTAFEPIINTLNEKSLHAELKEWYSQPGDEIEAPLDGFLIDIKRGKLLIEIQTGGFTPLKRKLAKLTLTHPVRLVAPIPQEKWIVRVDPNEEAPSKRRKSPKRGQWADLFKEVIRVPHLVDLPNFEIEALLIREMEVRLYDPKRAKRRKKWVVEERRLLDVVDQRTFASAADFASLIPDGVEEPFTTATLAKALKRPRRLAQQMTYALRKMNAIAIDGKEGNAILYRRVDQPPRNACSDSKTDS